MVVLKLVDALFASRTYIAVSDVGERKEEERWWCGLSKRRNETLLLLEQPPRHLPADSHIEPIAVDLWNIWLGLEGKVISEIIPSLIMALGRHMSNALLCWAPDKYRQELGNRRGVWGTRATREPLWGMSASDKKCTERCTKYYKQ